MTNLLSIKHWSSGFFLALFWVMTGFDSTASQAADAKAYVGSTTCKSCHEQIYTKWQGSHHDLAMQKADDQTVLGDFKNRVFHGIGLNSRFYRDKERYMVKTDSADGSIKDFEIKYTFGFYPLQQYLIEFPGGRMQVLDIAWDSRSKEQGGQRWIHLHPDERIKHDDVLHWTGPNLNWNYMCAECHSTGLQKNYDAQKHSYTTSWEEMDVACEACHGSGARHVAWAKNKGKEKNKGLPVLFDERKNVQWLFNAKTGKPYRSKNNNLHTEIGQCARCHSRRSQIAESQAGHYYMDDFIPSLLTEGLYYADGQVQDEVYVYGSFLQSRMYAAGVTCSDCHDPHSNQLKAEGELICYQCHQPQRYAATQHHQHIPEQAGASCIECHMPASTYMQVDARHDHSFRIPRPDVSVTQAIPNACNRCHVDKSAFWAAQKFRQWYGDKVLGFQQYEFALQAARQGDFHGGEALLTLLQKPQPLIAQATALQGLQNYADNRVLQEIKLNLGSTETLLRLSALEALAGFDITTQSVLAFPMLNDTKRSVRLAAIQLLAPIQPGQLSVEQAAIYRQVVQEYIDAQLFNADRPEAQVNLGNFYSALQQNEKALRAYAQARKLQKRFVPAYVNAAQLLSTLQQEENAQQLLTQGLQYVPQQADLAHALGLSYVRQQALAKALPWLQKSIQWDRQNVRYAYVYAVALNSSGQPQQALHVLQGALQTQPQNPDILYALVTFNKDLGDKQNALLYLQQLLLLMPGNASLQALQYELQNI